MGAHNVEHTRKIDGSFDMIYVPGGIFEGGEADDRVDQKADLFPQCDGDANVICGPERQK